MDQCWEMCQRKVKTPVPVTQNWLVCSLLKLLLAMLKLELPLDPEKDPKDLPAKEKEVKVENMTEPQFSVLKDGERHIFLCIFLGLGSGWLWCGASGPPRIRLAARLWTSVGLRHIYLQCKGI